MTCSPPSFPLYLLLTFMLSSCLGDFSPDPFDQPTQDAGASRRRDASAPGAHSPRDAGSVPTSSVEPPPETTQPTTESPAVRGCDLTGSWLMTERMVTSAVGAKQIIRNWFFVEIAEQGGALTVARSLVCGGTVVGQPPVIITMDDSKAWSSYLDHAAYEGRRVEVTADGAECDVRLEKMAVLRGMTPDYVDLELPLPTLEEPASSSEPGWEDWDGDGHPGVTLVISGTVSGSMYTATRAWTEAAGRIAADASSFVLPLTWGQARTTLGYDGSPLLAVEPGIDGDKSQHFAELARLSAAESAGDPASLCARLRELAPTSTPNAME